MPDQDHSPAFWSSAASTFKSNPAVLFDLFNEPFPDNNSDTPAAWTCWQKGGTCSGVSYQVAGMQELINTVRATGSTNVIMVGGIGYASVFDHWQQYPLVDPAGQLAASFHNYSFGGCTTESCWSNNLVQVGNIPLITGELGSYPYDDGYLSWADSRGISYLAWTWDTWGCSGGQALISNYDGTPCSPYGSDYQAHLATLTSSSSNTTTTVSPTTTTTVSPTTTTTVSPTTTTTVSPTTTTIISPTTTTTVSPTTTIAPTTTTVTPSSAGGTATVVSAKLAASWGNGANVDLRVTNVGSAPLGTTSHPWALTFTVPSGTSVAPMWNGSVVTQGGGNVRAVAPSYLPVLGPGASVDVGWTQDGSTALPSDVAVYTPTASGLATTYERTASWSNGANGAVSVTNPGASTARAWSLSFQLPTGTKVTNVWCAKLVSQSGGVTRVTGPWWAVDLAPGQTNTVGWTQSGSTAAPTRVAATA